MYLIKPITANKIKLKANRQNAPAIMCNKNLAIFILKYCYACSSMMPNFC